MGGELFSVLREKTLFDEDTARFFAASVVLAFEYMHTLNIIYRGQCRGRGKRCARDAWILDAWILHCELVCMAADLLLSPLLFFPSLPPLPAQISSPKTCCWTARAFSK